MSLSILYIIYLFIEERYMQVMIIPIIGTSKLKINLVMDINQFIFFYIYSSGHVLWFDLYVNSAYRYKAGGRNSSTTIRIVSGTRLSG